MARGRVPGLEAEVQAALTAVEAARAEKDDATVVVRIASGLNSGDMVVTAGVQFLRDGMPVRLLPERAAAAGNRI